MGFLFFLINFLEESADGENIQRKLDGIGRLFILFILKVNGLSILSIYSSVKTTLLVIWVPHVQIA